jgi:hypothetical protein
MAESAASAVVVFDSKIKFSPGAGLSISVSCAKVCGHLVRFRTIQVCPKDGRTFLTADFYRQQTGSRRGSLAGMIGSVGGRNPVFDLRRRDFITLIGAASAWPLGALLIVAALVAAIPALAHSWYPLACCGNMDCFPVACDQLVETGSGWFYVPTGNLFKREQVQPSQDHHCHVCLGRGREHRSICAFIVPNV